MNERETPRAAAVPSAVACAIDAPGLSRAMAGKTRTSGLFGVGTKRTCGVHRRACAVGKAKPGGVTPTISWSQSSRRMCVPMTSARPPNRSIQKPWLRMTTPSWPASSSD